MRDLVVQFARLWGQREAFVVNAMDEEISNILKGYDSVELLALLQGWAEEYLAQDKVEDSVDFFESKVEELYGQEFLEVVEDVLQRLMHNGPGDVEVSGKSDYELCFVGDHEKMVDFDELTKEEFLFSYSYLTEEEYDATQRVVDEYFPRAVRDFEELRVKVKSLPEYVELREACDLLGGHNFTEKEFFDLNYGCLCDDT